ncbi:MAG: hypothetical protein ACRDKU_09350 [Gaiellaceae bacterium]
MSPPAQPAWPTLRGMATAFCPPLEIVGEEPARLEVRLRDPNGVDDVRLRYRSERGLFLRTYFLVFEAEIQGAGPQQPGELVLRRRRLTWRRPKPQNAVQWQRRLGTPALDGLLRRLQVERLALTWQPARSSWRLELETLSGSLTVTFFPPLSTPNPLRRAEAEACLGLVQEIRRGLQGR